MGADRDTSEAAAVDAIAERRPLDLQQLGRPRLVAAADLERPADQVRFQLADAIVERDGDRFLGRPADAGIAAGMSGRGPPARSRRLAGTQPMRTVPQVQICAMRSQAFSSSRTLPGQL